MLFGIGGAGRATWSDTLTAEEVFATLDAYETLGEVPWARSLLSNTRRIVERLRAGVRDRSVYRQNPMLPSETPLLFELRVARDLHIVGATAEYEFGTAIGNSSVDFKVEGPRPWLIEVVRLSESAGIRGATVTNGNRRALLLKSSAENRQHTEEGEMLKAQDRISKKVFDRERPIKFPEPNGYIHAILVDARGYLGVGWGNLDDWLQIAAGPDFVRSPELVKKIPGNIHAPIRGLFEAECPRNGARFIRDRIHFICFVCEKTFRSGEIGELAYPVGNRFLLSDENSAKAALASWPMRASGFLVR